MSKKKPGSRNGMSPKQRLFIANYLTKQDATKAAIAAGYSPKNAKQAGYKALNHPLVKAEIDKHLNAICEKAELDAEKVMKQWAAISESDIRKFFTSDGHLRRVEELDEKSALAVSSVEVVTRPSGELDEDGRPLVENVHKIKLWDKPGTLRDAAKHAGMFVGKGDTPAGDAGPREFNIFIVSGKEDPRTPLVIKSEYKRISDDKDRPKS